MGKKGVVEIQFGFVAMLQWFRRNPETSVPGFHGFLFSFLRQRQAVRCEGILPRYERCLGGISRNSGEGSDGDRWPTDPVSATLIRSLGFWGSHPPYAQIVGTQVRYRLDMTSRSYECAQKCEKIVREIGRMGQTAAGRISTRKYGGKGDIRHLTHSGGVTKPGCVICEGGEIGISNRIDFSLFVHQPRNAEFIEYHQDNRRVRGHFSGNDVIFDGKTGAWIPENRKEREREKGGSKRTTRSGRISPIGTSNRHSPTPRPEPAAAAMIVPAGSAFETFQYRQENEGHQQGHETGMEAFTKGWSRQAHQQFRQGQYRRNKHAENECQQDEVNGFRSSGDEKLRLPGKCIE